MSTTHLPLAPDAPFATGGAPRRFNRRLTVVGSVVGLHVAAVWALQTGLLHRAAEMVMPEVLMAELIEPPKPLATPVPAPAPPTPVAKPQARPRPAPAPAPQPQPVPLPVQSEPSPIAPAVSPPEPAGARRWTSASR